MEYVGENNLFVARANRRIYSGNVYL